MTTVSTFAAFFMMPLWIFSLGKLVFHEANVVIPYANICAYGLCLVVPLGIGISIAR
jgi:sodium/bile acid cotransporter 3/5